MDKISFTKSIYSFPKIMNNENSTFYKTFYSNATSKATKSNINLKLNSISKTSLHQKNVPLSSYSNYTAQLKNNISLKSRNRKYTSLIKRKHSFSSVDTDDTFFALSEIKNMDKKIVKRFNKGIVWKEKMRNIYDMAASANKKDIQQVRKNIREYEIGSENFDLKAEINSKKYFPIEKVETINEANKIMNNMKKAILNEKKAFQTFYRKNQIDLNTFVGQNREICKKNFIIGLINNEREKIKIKEKEIKKVLENANKNFLKDQAVFEKFTLDKKRQFIKEELNVDLTIRNNKLLMEQIKKRNSNIHETESEMVRNIKGIILYKSYADFIHKLLGKDKIIADLRNVKNNLQSKEKDLASIVKNVIKQFNFLLTSGEIPVKTEEINNPDLLTSLFFSLEGNIIHQMRERDEILKEKFNEKKIFDYELDILRKKVEINQKKLNILTDELNISKNIYITDIYQERINEASELIYEISEVIIDSPIIKSKNKAELDIIIDATLSSLKKREDTINGLFEEIETIKKNDKDAENILKELNDHIKMKNKIQKYKEGREAMLNLEEEKNLKYLKKNYRYRIHGPIVYPPPYILERKTDLGDKSEDNKINEEEMLYYYDK